MKNLASIFTALLLALPVRATEIVSPLPNDCTIVALEAAKRLASTKVYWVDVISIDGFSPRGLFGHTACVFQITPFGAIHVYDEDGTNIMKSHSHDLHDIVKELGKFYGITVTHSEFER